jgi:hypothetical protein
MKLEKFKWYPFKREFINLLNFTELNGEKFSQEILLKYKVTNPLESKSSFDYSLGWIIITPSNQINVSFDKQMDYITKDPSKRIRIAFVEFFLYR